MQINPTAEATPQAVLVEIVKGFVPAVTNVHLDAVDEILERLAWETEPCHMRLEAAALLGSGFRLAEATVQFSVASARTPFLSGRHARISGGPVDRRRIDRVVNGPTEVPDSDNCSPAWRGEGRETSSRSLYLDSRQAPPAGGLPHDRQGIDEP